MACPHHFHPHLAGLEWKSAKLVWKQARLICRDASFLWKAARRIDRDAGFICKNTSQRGNGTGFGGPDASFDGPGAGCDCRDMRCVCKRAPPVHAGTGFARQRMRCVCKRAGLMAGLRTSRLRLRICTRPQHRASRRRHRAHHSCTGRAAGIAGFIRSADGPAPEWIRMRAAGAKPHRKRGKEQTSPAIPRWNVRKLYFFPNLSMIWITAPVIVAGTVASETAR